MGDKTAANSKIRVLLVEDSRTDAFLLVDTLGKFGGKEFELIQATDLDLALIRIQEEQIDVVLLDLSLPLFLGLEPLEQIHKMKPDLPVIVLSGYNDPELATEAMRKGAKNFFVKGHFDGEALVKMLRSAVGRETSPAEPQTSGKL
ncbi:MAG TPA: response regulator [bacterium]|nr:response regulator [bacterium]